MKHYFESVSVVFVVCLLGILPVLGTISALASDNSVTTQAALATPFPVPHDRNLAGPFSKVYVSTSGSDSQNGLSPAFPLRTLSRALSEAASHSGPVQVHLTVGTFEESDSPTLSSNLRVIGGFESSFISRTASEQTRIELQPGVSLSCAGHQAIYLESLKVSASSSNTITSSIAMRINDCQAVKLANVDVVSAQGWNGQDGAPGNHGTNGGTFVTH